MFTAATKEVEFLKDPANSKLYICPNFCGKSYKSKQGVAQHFRYECGKEPRFSCKYCTRRFYYKQTLKSHLICLHQTIDM